MADQSRGDAPFMVAVASRLRDQSDRARFLELSRRTEDWLKARPGFLRYELYELPEGWMDMMLWENAAQADAAGRDFRNTDIAKGFFEIINPDYSSYRGVRTPL